MLRGQAIKFRPYSLADAMEEAYSSLGVHGRLMTELRFLEALLPEKQQYIHEYIDGPTEVIAALRQTGRTTLPFQHSLGLWITEKQLMSQTDYNSRFFHPDYQARMEALTQIVSGQKPLPPSPIRLLPCETTFSPERIEPRDLTPPLGFAPYFHRKYDPNGLC